MADSSEIVVTKQELHSFITRCLVAVGTKTDHAQCLADLLVDADYRGHYSHGLNRLDMYIRDIEAGMTRSDSEPIITKETVATALVNGNNLLGPVVGKFCTDLAVKKAKEVGIGWVVAGQSNHFGIAGWYSMRAMEQGMIGMAFTNTDSVLVPTRAKLATLGTNPISVSAPGNKGDGMVLDMATTVVSLGKVEINDRKGIDIPKGWGCDEAGQSCTDAATIVERGGMLPLGGEENTAGYKGYGLAMMVEVFCGILSGSDVGPNIRSWRTNERNADLSHCFVAIDPTAFAPGFTDRMSELLDHCRGLEPAAGETEVLAPGDPEREHSELCSKLGGIPYHPNQIQHTLDIAKKLKVEPMKTLQL